MATRPGDWNAVGLSGDPVPGDPAVINGLADAMRRLADTAGTIHDGLNALQDTSAQGQRFIGKTAEALRGKVDEHLNKFAGSVRESFLLAEAAMRAYATAVATAQSAADQALNAAQGMAQDDPLRQGLTDRVNNARGELNAAVTQLSHQLTEAGQRMQMPVSNCELFWEAFEILTIIVSILAIFTGGLLGILAWAMNAVNFIKVAVDFSQGKASGLQLGLAFLGILFPSTKGIGGTLKALGKGIKAGGAAFLDDVGRIARLTGTSRLVVAPLLLGSRLGAGLRGFVPLVWTGMKSLGRAGLDDWAKVTGNLSSAWAKAGAYGMVTLNRLGRFGVAALLPLNFAEIGVVGFRGAAALAFADRVLGIPQHSLRQMMARAGDLEYLMKGVHPGAAGAGHGPGFPGRAGAHLGTGPFGGLRPGPGLGSVSTDLFHLSLTRTPSLDFTQLGFAKLGDVLLPRTGAAAHTGTHAAPGLHAVEGLVTPPLPENFTLGRGGLAVPATAADNAVTPLTHLDASLGQIRLDSNLLLPADTAVGVVQGARHPSGLSLLTDAPATGHGVEVPGGLAKAGDAVADSTGLARGAVSHAEDLADLKFPELLALQQGEITLRGISSDGISFRIGRDTDVTVNAQTLSSLAAGSHGGVPHTGSLPGAAGLPDGTVANAASHTATPHGGVPGALPAQSVPPVTTHVASPPHGTAVSATPAPTAHGTAHPPSATTLKDTAPQAPHTVKGADAPAPSSAVNSREQALALLKGDDARPRGAGLSASADKPAGGVSSRAALDAAGVSPSRVDTHALDLVARPGRSADTAGAAHLAQPAPQPPAPHPAHAGPTGDGAAPRGGGPGRPDPSAGPGDPRPPSRSGQTSPLGPAAPVPTHIEGHAAATVRNQLRLSIGHVITGGAADQVTAELRMQRYVAYENSLVNLRTAQRDAGAGAPRTPGGPSGGPSPARTAAQERLDAAVAEVKDARKGLRELGIDPDATLNEVRSLNARTVLGNGGVPGGSERPDLSRVLADEADEANGVNGASGANTAAEPPAGHAAGDLADQHLGDVPGPHGGAVPDETPGSTVPAPPPHPVTVGHVENRFAAVEGGRTAEFAGDPLAFLGRQPVYTAFDLGMMTRMPGLTRELANQFITRMGDVGQHWFVLVRAGDPAAREGTLLLTPAVERYVQAFRNGELFPTPEVPPRTRELLEELEAHPDLPYTMAEDNYLSSGFIPYKYGSATSTADIGNAVISRNPGNRVGAEFVFTPDMTGCALTVTDVTDDTFRAWHYQSPNGLMQREFATRFRAEKSPTEWFGDANYLGPMPTGYRNGATNILWRRADGSWHILSQEYRAPLSLELGAFTLPREPFVQPLRLTPGNELAYTRKIYDSMREEADLAVQSQLLTALQTPGLSTSTRNMLQEDVLEPITRTILGEDPELARITSFEDLATTVDTLKNQRGTTANGVRRALGDMPLPETVKNKITWAVSDFENARWLAAVDEAGARIKAGTHVTGEARPPGSAAETGPVPPAAHLAEHDAPAPAPAGGKGKGRADAQEPLPLPAPGGRPGARDAALAMQERYQVRQDVITGGTTGQEAEARLAAWDRYEIARGNLGELQARAGAGREPGVGPSTGPSTGSTRSGQLLQSRLDAAETDLTRAEDHLLELGIDPRTTSDRIDEAMARIRTGDGTALGGSRRGELPHAPPPQAEPAHLTAGPTDSGAPAHGLGEPVPDEALPDEALPDALDGLDELGELGDALPGIGHAPGPVAGAVAIPLPAVGQVENRFAVLEGVRTQSFAADPVKFLDEHPVYTDFQQGIRARMPELSPAQVDAFVQQMDHWDRHWFVLYRDDALPFSHRTVLLTPAVEKYAQAFGHTGGVAAELARHPGLLKPMADGDYLAASFIPYKAGLAKKADDIGNAVIRRTPHGGTGSEFVFTPQMNGCALAVTDVTEDTFRVWHYQSPGGTTANKFAANFRVGRAGSLDGRVVPERAVRDWIGDAMYLAPESGARYPGATNVLWRKADGSWHVLSQEYRASMNLTLDSFTVHRGTKVFPLHLTGGNEAAYTRQIYGGMLTEEGLKTEGELLSSLTKVGPRQSGPLQNDVLRVVFETRLDEEARLAAAGDFSALAETADKIKGKRRATADSLLETLGRSTLDDGLKERFGGIIERFGNPRWPGELGREARARLDAPAASRACDEFAEAYAERGRAEFEVHEWKQRFAGGAGPSALSAQPSPPELRLAAAEERLRRAGDELSALGIDPKAVQAEIEETITRSGRESRGLPGGMRRVTPDEPGPSTGAAGHQPGGSPGTGLPHQAPEAETPAAPSPAHDETASSDTAASDTAPSGPVLEETAPGGAVPDAVQTPAPAPPVHAGAPPVAPRPELALQEGLLTRALADTPEEFFASHTVSVNFRQNIAARMPWLQGNDIGAFLEKMDAWEGDHWFVVFRPEGRSDMGSTVMLTPAVEKYVQVNAGRSGLAHYVGDGRLPAAAEDSAYLTPAHIPYLSGNVDLVGIGHTRVPLVPDDRLGSNLVVTGTMNGCALAVTNVDETGFTVWHFQSPGSSKGADMRFRLDTNRSVVDWFGDAEYETPVKRGQFEVTNILWHDRANGRWKIISQESDMLLGPRGEWLGLSRTNDLRRELRLEPGGELAYTKKIYEGLAAGHRKKVDLALSKIDDERVWSSKEQYTVLKERLLTPFMRDMDGFMEQLLTRQDFTGLADLAESLTKTHTWSEEEIRQHVESWSRTLRPMESRWRTVRPFEERMDKLHAFLREYYNVSWAEHLADEARGRLAAPQPGHAGAPGAPGAGESTGAAGEAGGPGAVPPAAEDG
ncbi:putative T7SS-secreted protein [Streptomyces klenkii]|uniref:putative T7SS-secreted protein n=1 Tax=Streptomyces klenkii TaxID=1420899 RepID=UPI0033AE98C6